MTRILEDQSRVADEALHEADEKAKAMAKKLEMALSEIAAKDQLVKENIKVAEDAVIGIVSPSLPHHSFVLCWPIVNDVYGILVPPKLSHEPVLHEFTQFLYLGTGILVHSNLLVEVSDGQHELESNATKSVSRCVKAM